MNRKEECATGSWLQHTGRCVLLRNAVTRVSAGSSHLRMVSPKRICGGAVTFAVLAAGFWCLAAAQAQSAPRVPVLVELFTSEGCSDCPPADRLLEELDTKQPIPGAEVIAVSEHVTYWNRLGWRDPYSLDEVDARQKEYGERFNLDSVYTPQAVIDGSAQVVGNDGARLQKTIEHAASAPKKTLTIGDAHWESGAVVFTVQGAAEPGSKLTAVLVADASGLKITHGENAGKTLHHVAVARTFKDFGANATDGRALRLSGGSLAHEQASTPARLVVFVVDKKTGHVTAAAEQTLNR